ncbi:MAG: hypothetical protein IKY70_07110 [Bacteroidales bacterium]|nr:hypothetical protein [Bacteroidales bacterium]
MKKGLLIISLSVVTILLTAIFSVAQNEECEVKPTIFGKCLNNTDDVCVAYCRGCGEEYGPIDTSYPRKGKGILTRGICSECAYDFSTPVEEGN